MVTLLDGEGTSLHKDETLGGQVAHGAAKEWFVSRNNASRRTTYT